MTTGEPITQEEFETVRYSYRSGIAESRAVAALAPLTGVKFACRWKHYQKGYCGGASLARSAALAAGFQVNTRCKEQILYVFRYE